MKTSLLPIFLLIILLLLSACSKQSSNNKQTNALDLRGADVSFLPELRTSGLPLYNLNNQREDPLVTLQKSGVNTIRLRLWHTPSTSTSTLVTVAQLASEIKQMGMKVLLSVHYSDTWADPGQQQKPAAWTSLSYTQLLDSMYQYTRTVMQVIQPDYIQIGNEINGGLLWPEGSWSQPQQFKNLLKQGVKAVRETNPATKIILHYAGHEGAAAFFTNLSDVDYDIIGLSYYPLWHGKDLNQLSGSLSQLKQLSKPIAIVETSYPFTLNWNDFTNNIIGLPEQLLTGYPASPQGQLSFLNKLKSICADNKLLGFCYWGAEWVSYKGSNATNGSSWENQALWNFSGNALPAMSAFQ